MDGSDHGLLGAGDGCHDLCARRVVLLHAALPDWRYGGRVLAGGPLLHDALVPRQPSRPGHVPVLSGLGLRRGYWRARIGPDSHLSHRRGRAARLAMAVLGRRAAVRAAWHYRVLLLG